MSTVLTGGILVSEGALLAGKNVVLDGGKIAAITEAPPWEGDTVIDAAGRYISPGFADMHVHGGGGHDFADGTIAAFEGAARLHFAHGTTLIQPTVVSCDPMELGQIVQSFTHAAKLPGPLPTFHGIHMEGPFLNPEQAGAIDTRYLLAPTQSAVETIMELGAGTVTHMTAACELPGGLVLGTLLRARGIVASVGHSDAEYAQMAAAVDSGYTHVTHLYSAMSGVHRREAKRYLGVLESAYLLDGLTVEVIADGMHLPVELLRLAVKGKPKGSVALVTDAMRGAGMPDGSVVKLGSLARGRDAVVRDGVAYVPDFSCFAGSTATADRCVKTMWHMVGLPLADAVAMMTEVPCRIMGVGDHKGHLLPGYDGDLCLFDEEVTLSHVVANGVVYNCAALI